MMSRQILLRAVAIIAVTPLLTLAAEEQVQKFDEVGIIIELKALYPQVSKSLDAKAAEKDDKRNMAERALVTKTGVYALLENTQTEKALADIPSESPVLINGMLYRPGHIVHVERVTQVSEANGIDLEQYKKAEGKPISLDGKNKCQCGLQLGSLPTNCKLGHLHHLEAKDGKTYHYLHSASGRNAFLGKDCHFKKVKVTAKLFPGNFLLVEDFTVMQ